MSKAEELKKKMNTLRPGKTGPLLEVREYCKRQGAEPEDFWRNIPPATLDDLDEEQRHIMSNEYAEGGAFGDPKTDPAAALRIAQYYLDPKFKVARHFNQIFPFEVLDAELKIVTPIFEGDAEKILQRHLSQAWLEEHGVPLTPFWAKDMVCSWGNHAPEIAMPKPMARPDEDVWCIHRPTHEPDANVPYDRWANILSRMSDPKAFAAWIWGVYTDENKGRQVLWLHGEHGEDGKSAIATLIARELFGPAHHAISNASLGASEKRFLTSFFENASLVIYPDANNTKCLLSETFKTVASAGSDPVLIERKGKQAYTARLQARMWVCSNHPPAVTKDNYVLSRLLYVHIDKMQGERPDPKVIEYLKEQLPGFLHYAKQAYEERCPDHYRIITEGQTDQMVQGFADNFYVQYETIFDKHWELGDSGDFIEASKLWDVVRKEGITSNHAYGDFLRWLTEKKGVVKHKRSADGGRIRYEGMRKRRRKQTGPAAKIQW